MHDSVDRLQCFNCLYEVSFSAAWRISLLHVLRYIPELSLNCSSRPLSHYRSVESLKIRNRKYLYRLKYSLQENYFCCMLDAVVQFGELRVSPSLGLQRVFFFFLKLFYYYFLFIYFFSPVTCAGLGAVQRQVSRGDRQAGPADLEDSPPLRPQQEQRL